jgi:hypothetical protein
MVNTEVANDLQWLQRVQQEHSDFIILHKPGGNGVARVNFNGAAYCSLYAGLANSTVAAALGGGLSAQYTLFMKLDDDIVYLAPSALANLASAKLDPAHADWLFVSANVVNHPLLAHVQSRTGLQEREVAAMLSSEPGTKATLELLFDGPLDLQRITAAQAYTTFSDAWSKPGFAYLEHALLLYRLGKHGHAATSQLYSSFAVWNFDAQGFGTGRWSVNAFAFLGSDLEQMDLDECAQVDDEHYLTAVFPRRVSRQCFAVGDALVSHFSYYPQREALEEHTDLLERYAKLVLA